MPPAEARTCRTPGLQALDCLGVQLVAHLDTLALASRSLEAARGRRSYAEALGLPTELATVIQLLDDPASIDRGADTLGGTGTGSSSPPEVVIAIAPTMIPTNTTMAVRTSSMMAMIRAALACSRPDSRPPEASMRCLALLAKTRATTAPTGGQVKKPAMAITSAAVASPSVCGPGG
jgi:hypothetical protein